MNSLTICFVAYFLTILISFFISFIIKIIVFFIHKNSGNADENNKIALAILLAKENK